MCVTLCGRFGPDEGGVAGYVDRIGTKYAAKWGVQMVGMNFQTDPRAVGPVICRHEARGRPSVGSELGARPSVGARPGTRPFICTESEGPPFHARGARRAGQFPAVPSRAPRC
ncbi:DUF6783 domain-containing protein [Enterocloster lavalensis]|uniref:DUF6783 domain-containing protein n=1 Tax=Enterocloster lavalensis TaxID=460384 RepID=UPI002FE68815